MDLTKRTPRSVKDKFAGVVMLGRTTDKARATQAGKLGEYDYNCGMDQGVFGFLGIDHEEYRNKASSLDDAQLEQWVRQEFAAKKTPAELDAWNAEFLQMAPEPGSDKETYFVGLRDAIDPTRTDITRWADLLDLDEGRPVPHTTPA